MVSHEKYPQLQRKPQRSGSCRQKQTEPQCILQDHEGPQKATEGKENTSHGWEFSDCLKAGNRVEGGRRGPPWTDFYMEMEGTGSHYDRLITECNRGLDFVIFHFI